MQSTIRQFRANLQEVKNLGGIYNYLSRQAPSMDATDILRAQIVNLSSALDKFIHEIVQSGMVKIFIDFENAPNKQVENFEISVAQARELFAPNIGIMGQQYVFSEFIRQKHSSLSFLEPTKIADVLTKIGVSDLWRKVVAEFVRKGVPITENDIKTRLRLIYKKRNQIVHEFDIEENSVAYTRRNLDVQDVEENIIFISNFCEAIFEIVTNNP